MKKNLMTIGLAAMLAQAALAGQLQGAGESAQKVIDVNGVISVEAENYTTQTGYARVGNAGASGGAGMKATGPEGSRLDYQFDVRQAGTWYVWIRAYATANENNGYQLSLDGRYQGDIYLKKIGWSWLPEWLRGQSHAGPVTVNLTAGRHTFSILKRKIENPLIDKIVLTRSAVPPSGYGPAATPSNGMDAYEPDDTFATAKTIANGQTQSRSLHVAGKPDYAKFVVGGAGAVNVRLETSGTSGDTQLWLFKANGTLIAYDDNSGVGNFSRIAGASLAPGTYYVGVGEYGNNGTISAYALKANWTAAAIKVDAYEPDDIQYSPKAIANGQAQVRSIHAAGNEDWVKVTVGGRGGRNAVFQTAGTSGDTQLWLFKASGALIAYDDNSGVGNFSRIAAASLAPGTYYLRIREYGHNGTIPPFTLWAAWTAL